MEARTRQRISSRASLTSPPISEALRRERLEIARLRPLHKRSGQMPSGPLADAGEPLSDAIDARIGEDPGQALHHCPLDDLLLGKRAQMKQDARNVDLDGADLIAGAAQS